MGSEFIPIIMVTARTDTDSIVKGFETGVDDYITKPFKPAELMARVRSMLRIRRMQRDNLALRRELKRSHDRKNIIGQSEAMERVFALVDRVIDHDVTVLLTGMTGTGKESIARNIHYGGHRGDKPFVAANCGALSEGLLESELFGHKKGSFTGASEHRTGLFETASGGTVFLDEIGETSPAMQVKLLRVLQEGEITRVGEAQPRKIDVRVIAATNQDLEGAVRAGRFRGDLFYRLSIFPIQLPSLAERRDDIPLLANHFLTRFVSSMGVDCPGFTAGTLEALCAYDWPGNVRELENEVQRALVLVDSGNKISRALLSVKITKGQGETSEADKPCNLKSAVQSTERKLIKRALQEHQGNKSRMAQELGISRWTLLQKMKSYGLE